LFKSIDSVKGKSGSELKLEKVRGFVSSKGDRARRGSLLER